MAVEVDIRKRAGGFSLNVSFCAGQEIFALLGASGCGKSMTLKCIAGIETPDEGRIVLNGRTLFDSARRINLSPQKRRVGYMFQDYALFPNMTVEQNIMAGMGRKPSASAAADYIGRFRLDGLQDHLPGQLSGGQKQRVALARMMASRPEILLFDEPLSALDSFLRWQMEEELLEILRGIPETVIYVSHSRDEVYHLCDTVCVLRDGQVETTQEKYDFFADPKTVAAARISGCRNIAPAVRISAHELAVPDWDIRFRLERDIPGEITHAGVRAHYIEVLPDGQTGPNIGTLRVERLLEQQFESELILSASPRKEQKLRLLMEKKKAEELAKKEQLTVRIPERALLLLRG